MKNNAIIKASLPVTLDHGETAVAIKNQEEAL